MSRKSDFVSMTRGTTRRLWDVLGEIEAIKREFNSNDGNNWLKAEDFVGENADIKEADFELAVSNLIALSGYITTQNIDDIIVKIL